MTDISRRAFTQQAIGSVLTYSLLETLFRHDLFAGGVKPIAAGWLRELNDLGQSVQNQTLRHVEWQNQVEQLFDRVDLPELLELIDFERLAATNRLVDNGARNIRFKFPKVEGLPSDYVFGKQIFGVKKGHSIVPHGHNNMATAFLVLQGSLRGRHYDRLEDHDEHFIIRPTIDETFEPGGCSTVSDYKDNIHWFEALSKPAYVFNIHVYDVSPGYGLPTGRVYVNPHGEKLSGGLIQAPRIDYTEAHRLFG